MTTPETGADKGSDVALRVVTLSDAAISTVLRHCEDLKDPHLVIVDSATLIRVAYPAGLHSVPEWPKMLAFDLDRSSVAAMLDLWKRSQEDGRVLASRVALHDETEFRLTIVHMDGTGLLAWIVSRDPADPTIESKATEKTNNSLTLNSLGNIVSCTPAAARSIGHANESPVNRSLLEFICPNHSPGAIDAFAHVVALPGSIRTIRAQILTPTGAWRWFEANLQAQTDASSGLGGSSRLDPGDFSGDILTNEQLIKISLEDIDDDVKARYRLEQSESRFRALAGSMPIGVFHRSEGETWVNAALRTVLGAADSEEGWSPLVGDMADTVGLELFVAALDELPLGSRDSTSSTSSTSSAQPIEQLIEFCGPDGAPREARLTALPALGTDTLIGAVEDVTIANQHAAELARQARTDTLTGLGNRVAIDDMLTGLGDKYVGALFIDINDFKQVNDRFGHAAGDELLRRLAERLEACTRNDDLVARQGGDEFIVLCQSRGADDLHRTATRLEQELAVPLEIGDVVVVPSVSIGAATGSASQPDDLLRRADLAMYEQKRTGSHGVRIANASLLASDTRRRELIESLPAALEITGPTGPGPETGTPEDDATDERSTEHGMQLYYQPLVGLNSGRVYGAESLARLDHPTLGKVSPGEFLPLAERGGRMGDVARWGLERVLRDLRELRRMTRESHDAFAIGLNLSAGQLQEPGFADHFLARVDAAASPSEIVVEVTESHLIPESSAAETCLLELAASGIHLAIDDFGTGFSSLEYLTRFPVRYLKLDARYVQELPSSPRTQAVVAGLVTICNNLDAVLVAEGIETPEMLHACWDLGIHVGQGYLLARPAPLSELSVAPLDLGCFARTAVSNEELSSLHP